MLLSDPPCTTKVSKDECLVTYERRDVGSPEEAGEDVPEAVREGVVGLALVEPLDGGDPGHEEKHETS